MRSPQHCCSAGLTDERAFAQSDDRRGVLLEELQDALFLGLAHVFGVGIGIEVMGTDLVREDAERIERGRLKDGHVLGGLDGGTGNDGAGAGADEGSSGGDFSATGWMDVSSYPNALKP